MPFGDTEMIGIGMQSIVNVTISLTVSVVLISKFELVVILEEHEMVIKSLDPIGIAEIGALDIVSPAAAGLNQAVTVSGARPSFEMVIRCVAGTTGDEGVIVMVPPGAGSEEYTGPPAHTSVKVTSRFAGSVVEILYATV